MGKRQLASIQTRGISLNTFGGANSGWKCFLVKSRPGVIEIPRQHRHSQKARNTLEYCAETKQYGVLGTLKGTSRIYDAVGSQRVANTRPPSVHNARARLPAFISLMYSRF
jgi:hypothetical protein